MCAGEADAGADHGLDPLYDAFRFLKTVLQSFPRSPKILSWALLEPLEFLWRAHAEANDDPWNLLTPFVAQWLARFPVAAGYDALSLDELAEDLALLRARIFTNANLWSPLVDGIASAVGDIVRMESETHLEHPCKLVEASALASIVARLRFCDNKKPGFDTFVKAKR